MRLQIPWKKIGSLGLVSFFLMMGSGCSSLHSEPFNSSTVKTTSVTHLPLVTPELDLLTTQLVERAAALHLELRALEITNAAIEVRIASLTLEHRKLALSASRHHLRTRSKAGLASEKNWVALSQMQQDQLKYEGSHQRQSKSRRLQSLPVSSKRFESTASFNTL